MSDATSWSPRRDRGGNPSENIRTWFFFVPALTVLLFALIITLPWGFGQEYTYVPPMLIMALIFLWTVRCPRLMPSVIVFIVGISVDVLTASPIGFWAFLFLSSYGLGLRIAALDVTWPTVVAILTYFPVSVVVSTLAWCLTSAYLGGVANWRPVAESVQITWFICPVFALFVRWLAHATSDPANANSTTAGSS